MSITIVPCVLSVPFEELAGSPEEFDAAAWTGMRATRKLQCLARDRIRLTKELLGYAELAGPSYQAWLEGGRVIEHAPNAFPDIPGLYASSVAIKPFGRVSNVPGDTRFADYTYCQLDVTYEMLQKVLSDKYGGNISIAETIQDTSEYVTVNERGLYWGTGAGRVPLDSLDTPGKISYNLEWTYEISNAHWVPAEVFSYVGMVNATVVYSRSLGWTFPSGTLLIASPSVRREETFSNTVYQITLRFLYKNNGTTAVPLGWNYFPNTPAAGGTIGFEHIYDGADQPKIFYPLVNFGTQHIFEELFAT